MGGGGWRLARGRGARSAQLPLVVCAVLAAVILLLGKAEASIFDRARAALSDWASPALEYVREPLSAIERWVDGIGGIFSVYDENVQLKRENAELRKWQNVALSLERRAERYGLLINAVPDGEIPSIVARVIGHSSRPFIKTMILNAGAEDGVKPGQAVVDDRGMIGRVYLTGERTAWVILLTDLNSRVPVSVEPKNTPAILAGDNTPMPALDSLPPNATITPGGRVLTSGDGGLLPPGLPIGVVVADDSGPHVALFADSNVADYVQVLDYVVPQSPPPEAAFEATLPGARLPNPGPETDTDETGQGETGQGEAGQDEADMGDGDTAANVARATQGGG